MTGSMSSRKKSRAALVQLEVMLVEEVGQDHELLKILSKTWLPKRNLAREDSMTSDPSVRA
jgi:hypothetical protein